AGCACRTIRARDQEGKWILEAARAEIVANGRTVEQPVGASHYDAVFPQRLPSESDARAEVILVGVDQITRRAALPRQKLLAGGEIETGDPVEQVVGFPKVFPTQPDVQRQGRRCTPVVLDV